MAKVTSVITTWLGSKYGTTQGKVAIGGKLEANKGGYLFLEAINSGSDTENGGVFLFSDGTNVRFLAGTAEPSNTNTGGTALGVATGASLALDNLASVAINTSLISDTKNTDDLGSAAIYWKDLYIGGDIYCQEAGAGTFDVKLAFTAPSADYTYTFPNPGAAANVMLDTGAANVIAYTKGTSTIAMAANSDLAMATGITATFNGTTTIGTGGLVIGTGAVAINGSGALDVADGKAVDINGNVTIGATAPLTTSGAVAVVLDQALATTASPTFVGLTLSGAIATPTNITLSGYLLLGDDQQIRLGASGAADCYIQYDSVNDQMEFYDRNTATVYTLKQLATGTNLNPIVTGDLSIPDGNFSWQNSAVTEVATWTLPATTVDAIDIVAGTTTANTLHITSNACANGTIALLEASGGPGATGYYLDCYDGSAIDFAVGTNGNITGTGTLTLAIGDVDAANKISRTNATGSTVLLELEQTHATPTSGVLLLDSDGTGDVNVLLVENAGTGYAVSTTAAAAGGGGFEYISAASGTGKALLADGTTGGAAWVGANDNGFVQIQSDGALVAGANLLRVVQTTGAPEAMSFLVEIATSGAWAGSTTGSCLRVSDAGTPSAGIVYSVYVESTVTNCMRLLTVATGATNLTLSGSSGQTASMLLVDGTPTNGFVGAANVGMVQLNCDGTLANIASSMCIINFTGAMAAATGQRGSCLRLIDTSANVADSWATYISTTNNDGLLIDTGAVADINLKLACIQGTTGQMLHVYGSTGTGWLGANDVGCVTIDTTSPLAAGANLLRVSQATGAPVAASFLVEIVGAGTWAGSTLGTCLNITDTGAVAGTSYAAYIASTANSVLNLVSTAVATSNLVCTGGAGQTSAMASLTGAWVGAATTGMLGITCTGALVADASCLRISSAGNIAAANDGACLEVIESGAAQATSYAVRIASTSNEALHVDTGECLFDEKITCSGGVVTKVDVTNIANGSTPTNIEAIAAFGAAATTGAGFIGMVDDAGAHAAEAVVYSDGTKYWYISLTACA